MKRPSMLLKTTLHLAILVLAVFCLVFAFVGCLDPVDRSCSHYWGWVVTKTPTATTAGEETYTCLLCGQTGISRPISVVLTTITSVSINIDTPVNGGTPSTTASTTNIGYTLSTVSWSPTDSPFKANTAYTATVTLTANSGYTFSGLNNATINSQNVTVSNNTGLAVTLSYAFPQTSAKMVADIAIKTQPNNLTYTHGDTLDLSGLVVTLTYNDTTIEDVAASNFTDKGITASLTNGDNLACTIHNGQPITITFGNLTPITTNNLIVNPKIITSADINITAPSNGAMPNKTATGAGNFTISEVSWSPFDNLFLEGKTYTATVTLIVESLDYTFTGLNTATINEQSAMVSNNTGTAVTLSYAFPQISVTGIAIKTQPSKLTYTHGDTLDLSGLVVTLTYDDTTTEDVNVTNFSGKSITTIPAHGDNLIYSTHNNQSVAITYGSLTRNTNNLSVSQKTIVNAEIHIASPVKNALPSTSASGTGNFSIGIVSWSPTHNPFQGGIIYTASVMLTAESGYTFTGIDSATINGINATILNNTGSAIALSHNFSKTEEKTVANIAIKTQPTKLIYTHGDQLDLSGLVITLTYDDTTTEDVAAANFTDRGVNAVPTHGNSLIRSTHDGQPVTITYGDLDPLSTNYLTVNFKVITFTVDSISERTFTGTAHTPTITVKDGTTILTPTTDYTVVYSNNTNAGTANVTVTGMGNYAGSSGSTTFIINKAPGASVNAPTLYNSTSNSITINEVFLDNGQSVEYGINIINNSDTAIWQNTLTFSDLDPKTYYIFARSIGNTNYETGVPSSSLAVSILPVITINTQPIATTNLIQGNITGSLSVTATVTPSAMLSYQWYSNTSNSNTDGTAISGATSANYTIPTNLTAGTFYYFCEVRTTGAASVRSSVARVNVVLPVITINTQPDATRDLVQGNITSSLSVTATVTPSTMLSYQWYSNTSNSNTGGTAISGATNANYTIPTNLTAGTYYYFCEVRATGVASVRSSVAMVSVVLPVITINTQPTATTNLAQGNITGSLSVTATVTPSVVLSYQWYSNTSNSNTGGTSISGAINANYTIPTNLTAGIYYYFCEVRATGVTSVRSSVAMVNVVILPVFEMVLIPAGTFTMGGNGAWYANPAHQVTLTSGFYMGKYQVTQEQYQAVMGSNPSYFQPVNGKQPADDEVQGRRPVERVSWYDAIVFCNRLSILEDLSPAYSINDSTNPDDWGAIPTSSNNTWNAVTIVSGSTGYRLPTEAQWEYACRAGTTTNFYWGNQTDNATIGQYAWYMDNSNSKTHEVGKKLPNAWGLYDMNGNVNEWCWNWHEGGYTSTAKTDPWGASSGSSRVFRGGGWSSDYVVHLLSANRYYYDPDDRNSDLGFRVLRPSF